MDVGLHPAVAEAPELGVEADSVAAEATPVASADTLQSDIAAVLQGGALRAVDICRALAARGAGANKADVNRALYGGLRSKRFEIIKGAGAPAWMAAGPAAAEALLSVGLHVVGVGTVQLAGGLPDALVEGVLRAMAACAPPSARATPLNPDSAGGRRAQRLIAKIWPS